LSAVADSSLSNHQKLFGQEIRQRSFAKIKSKSKKKPEAFLKNLVVFKNKI